MHDRFQTPLGHAGAAVLSLPTRSAGGEMWEPWLDERAVAGHYGVSTRTIRRWRTGGMPSRVFGGVRRYRLSDCERWHRAAGGCVSVRIKNGRPIIEVYDPRIGDKRYVTQAEIRALGFDPPANLRQARRIEREVLAAQAQAMDGRDETVGSFTERWPDDFRRGKGGRLRSEATVAHNRERVRRFGREHGEQTLRSFSRTDARRWANTHPSTVPALRAMFSDAVEDRLADENPFARLGLAAGRGRSDIIVLTREEVHELARIARSHHGGAFGEEVAALILWAAYTCMRPGEIFAAQYSLLDGDVYDLRRQFNSTLGRETEPKHNSTGTIYVPEPARRAVLAQAETTRR